MFVKRIFTPVDRRSFSARISGKKSDLPKGKIVSQQTALTRGDLKRRVWELWAGTLALVLFFYWITAGFGRAREQSIEAFAGIHMQSVPVGTAAAKRGDLKIYLDEPGTVTPLKMVIVRARVDGELVDVYFKEGQTVKAGDLLAEIDPTLKLRAPFRNEDSALLPNQSVNTRLLVDTMRDAVLIPAPAVQRNEQGDFVYLVNADQTVALRSVDVGATQGDTSAISRGLNPGELVVVDGTNKLHRGSRVIVQLAEDSTDFPNHPASVRSP
jgi:multidrug efflux pump subunit AcrA (membrane-fusion protein)